MYKFGDKVIVNGNKGTVVSVFAKKANVYYCTVRFDDKNLIPSEMDFDQNQIQDQSDEPVKKIETKKNHVIRFTQRITINALSFYKPQMF